LSGLGSALIDLLPGPGIDISVATAESMDKALLAGILVLESLGAGALAARLVGPERHAELALLVHGALTGAAAASRPRSSACSSLAAGLLGGAAGAGVLRQLRRRPSTVAIATAAAGAAAAGGLTRVLRERERGADRAAREAVCLPLPARPAPAPPPGAQLDVAGLTAIFTAPRDFYRTDVAFPAPRVEPRAWRLRVHGLVERELQLSLDDLLAMDLVELDATLVCVHNPVGGPRIGTARWLGVHVADLLEQAGPQPAAQQLVARSVDGFTAGVPLEHITAGKHALVALGLGGEPLQFANGFPARLLIPGFWGAEANTKWLCELELTTWAAVEDYWDRRGWPRRPTPVRPGSRIDVPAHRAHLPAGATTIAGVAWAPPAGVTGVEVSIDREPWRRAVLAAELAPTAWRQWRLEWQAAPGEHRVRVRALGRAEVQAREREPPYPRGSAGYHEVRLWVHADLPRVGPARRLQRQFADAIDDVERRLALAAMAPPAWLRHGYPRRPDFPEPTSA
jgi:DMSO/TMAO reductase YedYZ molybdopterin-dependent catalytic subunit